MRSEPCRWGVLLLLVAGASLTAFGLDKERTISQFVHTSWTASDGGPSGLTSLAQTKDGYLWLGTQTGLIRFDGVRFKPWVPPDTQLRPDNIASLLPTSDGGLWIGLSPNGAAFLKDGKIHYYGLSDGLPSSPVYAFGFDGDGGLWLGTFRGLRRFDGSHWQAVGADWGFPDTRVDSFYLDHQRTLWVSTLDGLYCLPAHARTFQERKAVSQRQVGETIRSPRLGETHQGILWINGYADDLQSFTASGKDPSWPTQPTLEPEARQILMDRDNAMWVFTYNDGIARVANPKDLASLRLDSDRRSIDHFTQQNGLSDNRIMAALEDREGNIWVATRGGLDRFRARNVAPGPFPYGSGEQDLALAVDAAGAIWAGNLDQPLMRFRNNVLSVQGESERITCAFRDSDGTIWFGGEGILEQLVNGSLKRVALPEAIRPGGNWAVHAITRDRQGDLWVSIIQNGVYRRHGDTWTHFGNVADLPKLTALVMLTDSEGRIWFGYTLNRLAVLSGNSVRTFSSPDGLEVGSVTAIVENHGHIWVGGVSGLAYFDGERFHLIHAGSQGLLSGVSGIVETRDGDLWLNQASGLAHIPAAEVAAILKDSQHKPVFELFNSLDGVPGIASPLRPLPSEILAADGRIWISGTDGTSWIDPARLYKNPFPPPVSIESLLVDGEQHDLSPLIRLPKLPSNVQIEYTALSLSIPERVRFRYKLEGFDNAWQDAESRRVAFYTRLGPGRYRFHVIASNNDGVWNNTGAAIEIVVPPAFFQTVWFKLLWASLALSILWMLYLMRLRQFASYMRGRLRERLAERERIARELHDTLLQGFQATILSINAATERIPAAEPARRMIEEALNGADGVMVEARDRVRNLRVREEILNSLPEAFRLASQQLAGGNSSNAFCLDVKGIPRKMDPLVSDEVYQIGREALANAFQHASADRIEIELTYGRREFQLRIADNGCGIDPTILEAGGRPGHWGLSGMRERAARMRASLDIRSFDGAGTAIVLSIPAAAAYRNRQSGSILRWMRRIEDRDND